jgi:hypothetical protein
MVTIYAKEALQCEKCQHFHLEAGNILRSHQALHFKKKIDFDSWLGKTKQKPSRMQGLRTQLNYWILAYPLLKIIDSILRIGISH